MFVNGHLLCWHTRRRHDSDPQDSGGESDRQLSECFLLSHLNLNSCHKEQVPCFPNLFKAASWHCHLVSRIYSFPASLLLRTCSSLEGPPAQSLASIHAAGYTLSLSILGHLEEQQHCFLGEGRTPFLNAETLPNSGPVSWWWWQHFKCDKSPGIAYGSSHWPYKWIFTSSCAYKQEAIFFALINQADGWLLWSLWL